MPDNYFKVICSETDVSEQVYLFSYTGYGACIFLFYSIFKPCPTVRRSTVQSAGMMRDAFEA